jgi:hypothetical protein
MMAGIGWIGGIFDTQCVGDEVFMNDRMPSAIRCEPYGEGAVEGSEVVTPAGLLL